MDGHEQRRLDHDHRRRQRERQRHRSYSVAANTGTASRTGTLTIAGQTFTVTQAGSTVLVLDFTGIVESHIARGDDRHGHRDGNAGCVWTADHQCGLAHRHGRAQTAPAMEP